MLSPEQIVLLEKRIRNKTAQHRYYWRHHEEEKKKSRKRMKKWRNSHPEIAQQRESKWKKSHPEKVHGQRKRWNLQHPDRRREYAKRWRYTHPEKWKEYKHQHEGKGFAPIAPNIWNCKVDWHYLAPNYPYVVPLPRKIHRAICGKNHFIFNAMMVCQLYNLNLESKMRGSPCLS